LTAALDLAVWVFAGRYDERIAWRVKDQLKGGNGFGNSRDRGESGVAILGLMPPAVKHSKAEKSAARLKKKNSGPSAMKRAATRKALQDKKNADQA
jgi:hypothetical protein